MLQADRWENGSTPLLMLIPEVKMHRLCGCLLLGLSVAGHAASFTVRSLDDDGPGTLREAVAQANAQLGPDSIDFAVTGTIVLTSGAIRIAGPLTITGRGTDRVVVSGNRTDRIFTISASDQPCAGPPANDFTVAIARVSLIHARNTTTEAGGAIYSEHSLALDDVVIAESAAGSGGAVAMLVHRPGQSLRIERSLITGNSATPLGAVAGDASGGAIAVKERCARRTAPVAVSISRTRILGNRVQPGAFSGTGGAIASFSHADVVIADSVLGDNRVEVPDPPVADRAYRGGAFYGSARSLLVQRSEISGNRVDGPGASGVTRGGAFGVLNVAPDLQEAAAATPASIVDSTISGNSVSATGAAMWVAGNVSLRLFNSTMSDNRAAPGRTHGIVFTTGLTDPPIAGDSRAPSLALVSSILADAAEEGTDFSTNTLLIPSLVVRADHSLVRRMCTSCNLVIEGTGNLLGVDPVLGPLADNGGDTRTHAPFVGSPVIDAGIDPLGLAVDQRGRPRTSGGASDIGAYEADWSLVAALLPSSRAVAVGGTATAFATLVNAGTARARGCAPIPPSGFASEFSYQTTDAATNFPTGTPMTAVSIAPGQAQSFVLSIRPLAPLPPTDIPVRFQCASGESAGSVEGVNTFLLTASPQPTPDLVTAAATASGDGVVRLSHSAETAAFGVAAVNVGVAGEVTVAPEPGRAPLPATLAICRTDPQGNCLQPRASAVSMHWPAGETATFSVFVTGLGVPIVLDPARTRVLVRFRSGPGLTAGATSVAVQAP